MSRILEALKRGPLQHDECDVLFNTLYRHEADGWAIASRAYARAMYTAGIDVRLRQWINQLDPLADSVQAEIGHLIQSPTSWGLYIFSATLSSAKDMQETLDTLAKEEGKRAYYCVFERRHIEPEIVESLNKIDAVWVQCKMNRDVLEAAGTKNVTLIPYPYFDDDPHFSLEPTKQATTFYNIGRFEPRKDPANIVRAFFRAFTPRDRTQLVIKTSPFKFWSFYPTPERSISTALREPEAIANGWNKDTVPGAIQIITSRLTPDEMVALHRVCDVYVSSSRGEGLDLPAFAAKLAGRRIVTTASGGPEDFLDPEVDVVVPATGLVPADPAYKWGPGADYIDYSLDALAEAMRRVHRERRTGSRTWPGMSGHHAAVVGEILKYWMNKVTK